MEEEEYRVRTERLMQENSALHQSLEEMHNLRKKCVELEAEASTAKVVSNYPLL